MRDLRAWALQRLGRHREAVADLTILLEAYPRDAELYDLRATSHAALGEHSKSEDDRQRSLTLPTTHPRILNNQAWHLVTGPPGLRDPKRALELIRSAIAKQPNNSTYLNTLGVAEYAIKGGGSIGASAVYSPDGTLLAHLGGGATVTIRDAATGRPRRTLKGHAGMAVSAGFSPDGKTLFTAADDDAVLVWDAVATDDPTRLDRVGLRVEGMALSADRTRVAAVWLNFSRKPFETRVRVWDAAGKLLFSTDRVAPFDWDSGVFQVALSPDGARVAVAYQTGKGAAAETELWVWSVTDGKKLAACGRIPGSGNYAPAFSPDGTRVALTTGFEQENWRLTVCDAATGKEVFGVKTGGFTCQSPVFNPDGRLIALKDPGKGVATITIRDATTGRLRRTLRGHPAGSWDIAFSADGTRLFSYGTDGAVRTWDATGTDEPVALPKDDAWLSLTVASQDSARFATMRQKKSAPTVEVWDRTGRRLVAVEAASPHQAHTGFHNGLALDHGGRRVAFTSQRGIRAGEQNREEGRLFVWDVETGKPLVARRELGGVHGCALSPDGRRVAALFLTDEPSPRYSVVVWDVDSGNELHRFDLVGLERASEVAFSPDGGHLGFRRCRAAERRGRWRPRRWSRPGRGACGSGRSRRHASRAERRGVRSVRGFRDRTAGCGNRVRRGASPRGA